MLVKLNMVPSYFLDVLSLLLENDTPLGMSEEHYDKLKSKCVIALYLFVQIFSWKLFNLGLSFFLN